MSDSQKNAAAMLALLFLVFVTGWLITLVASHNPNSMQILDEDRIGRLTLLWSSFRWMVDQGEYAQKTFVGFLAIISVGAKFLANANWFKGQTAITSIICAIGILLSAILLIVFWDMDGGTFRTLDDNASLSTEALRNAIAVFLAAVTAWYIAFLELQLGLVKSAVAAVGKLASKADKEDRLRDPDGEEDEETGNK